MRGHSLLLAGLACLAIGVIGQLALFTLTSSAGGPWGASAAGRGAWMFQMGTAPDGRPLAYAGGMMMRMSCAQCHGAEGRGLRTPMFIGPDITYRNLTDPAGMLEPDGDRGPTYNDESIARAVTQGIDAEGKPIAWPMPSWRLTAPELADLLAYLESLP